MQLRELDAKFIRLSMVRDPGLGERQSFQIVEKIEEAQGIMFICPGCAAKMIIATGRMDGAHSLICWSRECGIPDEMSPGPGRWRLLGTGIDDLTLEGDPPGTASSVDAGCWHGFVRRGIAQ